MTSSAAEEQEPRLVDTHCHLQDGAFDDDREAVIKRSLEALDWLVVIGDDLSSSRAAAALIRDGVYAAVGVHPYHAEGVGDGEVKVLRELAGAEGVVAIGEIGFDYYKHCEASPEAQERAFLHQLQLASELDLPVVIHNREGHGHLSTVLNAHRELLNGGGIMHCFPGDAAFVRDCVEWGFHISFAGNVTFPKAEELRESARLVPADRLLVETDSPYLAPQPVRGKRCEPAYVQHTAAVLAEVRQESFEELAAQTTANAAALFGVQARP